MIKLIKLFFFYLFMLLTSAWSCAALNYALGGTLATVLIVFFIATVLLSLFLKSRVSAWRYYPFLAFFVVLTWWLSLEPSNDKAWQPDVATTPYATFSGDKVTVHNIRSNNYKSETDYELRYYDKTFDLNELKTVDLIASYWGMEAIAHLFLSFGFADGSYLAISAETRKQVGQEYDAIAGFFRKYALIYIVADEKDLIGVRTNYRHEDVYLYRLKSSPSEIKQIFISYLTTINELKDTPAFYNSLIDNCTTNIVTNIRASGFKARPSRAWLATGLVGEVFYERQTVYGSEDISYQEFKAKSRVNDYAKIEDTGVEFSKNIRAHLPFAEK